MDAYRSCLSVVSLHGRCDRDFFNRFASGERCDAERTLSSHPEASGAAVLLWSHRKRFSALSIRDVAHLRSVAANRPLLSGRKHSLSVQSASAYLYPGRRTLPCRLLPADELGARSGIWAARTRCAP